MPGPGRDARVAMERVLRLLTALHDAGRGGLPTTELVQIGGYPEGDASDQLSRDFRNLKAQGWRIDNVVAQGGEGRYVLSGGDNRLRLKLTEAQQVALQRAALLADRDDLVKRLGLGQGSRPVAVQPGPAVAGQSDDLTVVIEAVRRRQLVRFRYAGKDRVVHPGAVRHQSRQWYLTAVEDGAVDESAPGKNFVVGRMTEVRADKPGTARPVPEARLVLHPLRWEIDPATEVVLRTHRDYLPDVQRWLREPDEVRELDPGADVEVTYTVTNRAAFRSRVYALGPRVTVVGPDEFRSELLDELAELGGL